LDADTQTPPPTISMVNDGVKGLSMDPIPEHPAPPRGPDGYVLRIGANLGGIGGSSQAQTDRLLGGPFCMVISCEGMA
jgi:hypothetical protein